MNSGTGLLVGSGVSSALAGTQLQSIWGALFIGLAAGCAGAYGYFEGKKRR